MPINTQSIIMTDACVLVCSFFGVCVSETVTSPRRLLDGPINTLKPVEGGEPGSQPWRIREESNAWNNGKLLRLENSLTVSFILYIYIVICSPIGAQSGGSVSSNSNIIGNVKESLRTKSKKSVSLLRDVDFSLFLLSALFPTPLHTGPIEW
jgi:hypothetical protein